MTIGKINPSLETRAGRMMAAGRVKITIKSLKTGAHLTLAFRGWKKEGNEWKMVPFSEATNISIKDASKIKLGTFYPQRGTFYLATQNTALLYALAQAVLFINGEATTPQAEISEANECGRCGRQLTDPVSCALGLGPTCNGEATGSRYATQTQQQALGGAA